MDFTILTVTAPNATTDSITPQIARRRSHFSGPFKKPVQNAKHGHIEGIKIGDVFKDRRALYEAGGHNKTRGGICGDSIDGLFAIVVNNGYEDDADNGDEIEYTGAGGRDLSNSWSGPQIKDQDYDGINRAFKRAVETGKPVRVFRGSNLQSKWGPHVGYRYDGLYDPIRTWREEGKTTKTTCRILLRRQAGQPPIPTREICPRKHRRKSGQKKTLKCEQDESKPRVKQEPDDGSLPPVSTTPPISVKREAEPPVSVKHETDPQRWFASLPRHTPEEEHEVEDIVGVQTWFASLQRRI